MPQKTPADRLNHAAEILRTSPAEAVVQPSVVAAVMGRTAMTVRRWGHSGDLSGAVLIGGRLIGFRAGAIRNALSDKPVTTAPLTERI